MKICVAIFVFISAFGITRSYLNTNSTTTYIILRRILKLHLNFFFVFWFVQIIGSIITPGRFTKIYHLGSGFRHIIQASLYYLIDMLGLSNLLGTPTYLTTFWYMSLALIIIIAVPVFIKIQNCLGTALLFALIIIISAVFKIDSTNTFAYFPIYAGSIFWGIVSARYDIIDRLILRINKSGAIKNILFSLAIVFFIILTLILRFVNTVPAVLNILDGSIAFAICLLFAGYINKIPIISEVLSLIGKYSMTIFLTHNFIRVIWFYDFTYSFKYWWLILLVLLGTSFVLSLIIECLRKITGYGKLADFVFNNLLSLYLERKNY